MQILINKYRVVKIFFCCFFCFVIINCNGQDSQKDSAKTKADTINFKINKSEGWSLYDSYVNADTKDSVSLFLIVEHTRNKIDYKKEQLVGKIKDEKLFPKKDQKIIHNLLNDKYIVQIDREGKCYINLSIGSLPVGDPVIIPIQIKYPLE